MALQYWTDNGKLAKVFETVKKEYFPKLKPVRFLYTLRSDPKFDDEGRPVGSEASKLSNRERDLFGFDFEICTHADTWEHYSKKEKRILAWHELNHCRVEYELEEGTEQETNKVVRDKAERVSIYLMEHDIVIKTFMEELELFGPCAVDASTMYQLYKYCKKHMKKVKRQRKVYLDWVNTKDDDNIDKIFR